MARYECPACKCTVKIGATEWVHQGSAWLKCLSVAANAGVWDIRGQDARLMVEVA